MPLRNSLSRRYAALVAGAALLAVPACGSRSEQASRDVQRGGLSSLVPPPNASRDSGLPQNAAPQASASPRSWRGSYRCGSTRAGLEVSLAPAQDGVSEGTLSFFPEDRAAQPARGCHRVTAHFEPGGRIWTEAGSWVRYPPDAPEINLDGRLTPSGNWSGRVSGPGCSDFQLEAVSDPQENCS